MRRTRTGGQGTARAESITVNAAGLVQGIALVTFPAASAIFTARSGIPGRRGCARWPHAISAGFAISAGRVAAPCASIRCSFAQAGEDP